MPITARERARRRIETWWLRRKSAEGESQKAFANYFGRSQGWASKLLATGPRLEDLDQIAERLGITPEMLVAPIEESGRAGEEGSGRAGRGRQVAPISDMAQLVHSEGGTGRATDPRTRSVTPPPDDQATHLTPALEPPVIPSFVPTEAHVKLWGLLIGLTGVQAAAAYEPLSRLLTQIRAARPGRSRGRRGREPKAAGED